MHPWSGPDLPSLPGRGGPLRLYDTAARAVVPTSPGPTATMYVCGITPYDSTHLGHAATYVAFDLVNRVWRDAGHDVHYVQNVTDVDDPLLERAEQTGDDWRELARAQTLLFTEDMAWLRVLPPREFIGAVEAIPLVVELIERLREASAVYDVDGDLYFSVRADPRFGGVAGLDESTMRALFAERGGDPDRDGKKDPLDCLLWRRERPGEPVWASALGPGRPGWHIECTAIALRYLGMPFDLQGGGSDLAFPHHEMCASEAHVALGTAPFARSYVHAGMIGLHGEKMSKSLGNLVFAAQLRDAGTDPMAVRLALLADHYRSDREWTDDLLVAAQRRLERWRLAGAAQSAPDATPVLAEVRARLADDLDTPGALAAIDGWADATLQHGGPDPSAAALVTSAADALLGIRMIT